MHAGENFNHKVWKQFQFHVNKPPQLKGRKLMDAWEDCKEICWLLRALP